LGRRRSAEERTPPWGNYGSWRPRRFYAGDRRIEILWRPNAPRLLADAEIARVAQRALEAAEAPTRSSLGIVLTDDDELTELNREYMGEVGATDVLSFPLLEPGSFRTGSQGRGVLGPIADPALFVPPRSRLGLGDVVISVERAIAQAQSGRAGQTGDVKWSAQEELRLLITHGVLHICGWDHAEPKEEAAMRALEQELLSPAKG
jgi:probable rRNA maturation factor